MLEYLLGTGFGYDVGSVIEEPTAALYAPEVCDVEVADGVRGMIAGGVLDLPHAEQTLTDYVDLPISIQPHRPLLGRMIELGDPYVVLAEILGATLVTADVERTRIGQRASLNVVGVS